MIWFLVFFFFFSSRRRHTRCALVTGVQTCALPIYHIGQSNLGDFQFSPIPIQLAPAIYQRRQSARADTDAYDAIAPRTTKAVGNDYGRRNSGPLAQI